MNKKFLLIGIWTLITLVIIVLGSSAVSKFFHTESQIMNAQNWGFNYWLMYLIAVYELLVVALLLFGKKQFGAIALAIMMLGAIVVHLANNEALYTILNFILIGFAFGIYALDKKISAKALENMASDK